ncbi:hypothetical protein FSP39_024933 [Pinctada imbricata]|uniref:CTCHY-type domain-containing protein n=1 Tax=Pinctada imbricata TaxID=66713 RepID=A0AA88YCY5_PINIB|nr:hypothetical protein FSP39_024933 [Pinctada imbricata]
MYNVRVVLLVEFVDSTQTGSRRNGQLHLDTPTNQISKCRWPFLRLADRMQRKQYLFSERTVDFILSALKDLQITHVLCVGAPRIHETIQNLHTEGSYMDSMLLDLDTRYMQFYSEEKFYKYNMFNNHFFGRNEEALDKFLTLSQGKNVIMVTDPPFGGMVQALAESVKKFKIRYSELNADFCNNNELPVLWFFPYFMEPKMKEYLPDFSMLDYKVDYNNHLLYKEGKKERGSPVRIFTNVEPSKVIHPNAEGYWYCDVCKRYSAKENLHCDICGVCPSKDGRTYRHCYDCERCVKPNKVHCKTCGRCDFPDHKCGVTPTGCHICGNLEHKRRDCPQKDRKQDRLAMKRIDGADRWMCRRWGKVITGKAPGLLMIEEI